VTKLSIPNIETVANSDVDGKRKGFISPFIATAALKIANDPFRMLRKTKNSIFSVLRATYAYAPPIEKV
jgi:hypothetical protein